MKTNFLILILAFSTSILVAQKKLADKFFDNYGYVKASELYAEAVKKGDSSEHVLTRLGDSYYNNSDSKNAVIWYSKAVNKYDKIAPEYLFKYIQTLKSVGNYAEASTWMKKLVAIQSKNVSTREYDADLVEKYNDLLSIDNTSIIEVVNLPFNTPQSDFGSYIHNNQLFFASATGSNGSKVYAWNKEPFLDLYQISVEENDSGLTFGNPGYIKSSKINSDYHEASVAITNDGKTIYFTRDNMKRNSKLDYDKKGTTHLKIYKATLVDGSWENIKELPFNDEVFSTGHPALSPDNKKLYFVSDMDGGFGQTDIYEVDILENDKFSKPKNLGDKINTQGREMFPFIGKDSIFYFSSDGHLNLGLLDIFKSNILKDPTAEAENLGAPYNSGYDDFAFFIDPSNKSKRGYFSSNRPEGKGNDDIYTFYPRECAQIIRGTARDKVTNDLLNGVSVKLLDKNGKLIKEVFTDENGAYEFSTNCNHQVTVLGSKPNYLDDSKDLALNDTDGTISTVDLMLDPLIKGNQIAVNPIYFDFDKSNIRTDAEYELEKVIDVLRIHPNMSIKIESHTDSRGSEKYNMKLSEQRAKSSRDYIVSRGIDSNRIESATGYGETKLINGCDDSKKCTEEEHQLNRRTQFIILNMP
ncbi:OmpA family protein [Mariniflexile sp.]|uniref:OmpA family protein n=1 Tax=Mariniflexile sp. TaxID=1979402 RepID=UPI0040485F36